MRPPNNPTTSLASGRGATSSTKVLAVTESFVYPSAGLCRSSGWSHKQLPCRLQCQHALLDCWRSSPQPNSFLFSLAVTFCLTNFRFGRHNHKWSIYNRHLNDPVSPSVFGLTAIGFLCHFYEVHKNKTVFYLSRHPVHHKHQM